MKDNKKRFIVVAVLGVVIVSVGAFQFMGGSSPAPAPTDTKKKEPMAAATPSPEPPKNPLVSNALPERDPFEVPAEAQPSPTPAPPTVPSPPAEHAARPIRNTERMPVTITGELPGATPTGDIGATHPGGPALKVEPEFDYHVIGVVVGAKPLAVFSDSQGNQRLVPLGGSLGNGTTVTGIQKGKVTLRFRGKTLRFQMDSNNAK